MKALSYHPVAKWIIGITLIIGVFFFHSFLVPALGAMIIAFVTWRAYLDLLRLCRGRKLVASSIATSFIIMIIVLPFFWLAHFIIGEVTSMIRVIRRIGMHGADTPEWIKNLPLVGDNLDQQWMEYLSHPNGLNELLSMAGLGNVFTYLTHIAREITGHFTSLGFTLLFVIVILFFLYKDGEEICQQLDKVGERVFPGRWHRISRIVPTLISSTVSGMVLIAIGEGIVFGIVYYFVGAPTPVTLAVITGVFALIPGGAPLSMTAVSLYLVGSGSTGNGIALFIWGAVQLFVVDKTIRPRLVGGPVKLPFLPTILGLVGGVKTMGLIGLFLGPVIMALLVALWREWVHEDDQEVGNELEEKIEAKKESSREPCSNQLDLKEN